MQKNSFVFADLFRAGPRCVRGEPCHNDTDYPAADECLDAEIGMYIPTAVF